MKGIKLLVRGSALDVQEALTQRGFHLSDCLTRPTLVGLFDGQMCQVHVKEECEPGVLRWYTEPPDLPPFPVGTLLHYHIPKKET